MSCLYRETFRRAKLDAQRRADQEQRLMFIYEGRELQHKRGRDHEPILVPVFHIASAVEAPPPFDRQTAREMSDIGLGAPYSAWLMVAEISPTIGATT